MSIAEKLQTIAENEQKVYDKGYTNGHADGIQSEYDRFWDGYQNKGKTVNMPYAFAGSCWHIQTGYKPKYTIKSNNINYLYYFSSVGDTIVDIDLSAFTGGNKTYVFAESMMITVRKVILPADTAAFTFPNWFLNAKYLKNITFEGGNICKSIDFSSSPLEVETMKHIISRLENHNGTDNEGVNSVKFKSTCWTALEADSTAPDGGTWKEYVTLVLGWTT